MREKRRDYFLRRAGIEKALGDAAALPQARDIHYRLAELHRVAAAREGEPPTPDGRS